MPGRLRTVVALIAVLGLLASAGAALAQSPRAVSEPSAAEAAGAVEGLARALADKAREIQAEAAAPPRSRAASLTEDEARAIAGTSGRLHDWIDDRELSRTAVEYDAGERRHTVWYVSEEDGEETVEAQVFVSDETGEITEVRTGPQVAWMMARGYEGAFGRALNEPVVWLSLCAIFFVGLLPRRPRRLLSVRTLDLFALLSFSISLIWFNQGEIFTSVPLQYPPLVYLAVRLTWIAVSRVRAARAADAAEPAPGPAPPAPRRPSFAGWAPTWVLVTLLAVTLALRFGLNAFDSNVIDVGYAGVIGADRIAHGATPYGTFPADECGNCDTYGPLTYLAYVPFELAQPWDGKWDSLPAAHGAASAFDLLCIAGLLVLGWRLSGLRLGMALALAWSAFPFTAYALETNSNDALPAAALIWGLVVARNPLARGLMLGLALATKFAPAVLLPLWSRRPYPRGGGRSALPFAGGVALAAALTGWVVLLDGGDGLRRFWSRTIGYQLERDSPFSIWGQYPGLRPLQIAVMAVVVVGALAVLRWPRRLDLLTVTALSGALMVGLEMTATHWFYLYIPWFLPFALVAMVPDWPPPARSRAAVAPAEAPAGAPLAVTA